MKGGFVPWQAKGPTKHSVAIVSVCLAGHEHDSKREAKRCDQLHLLERAGEIAALRTQPEFKFWINGSPAKMDNGHEAGVTLDFSYVCLKANKQIVEDVKPRSKKADSRDWPLRKAIFKACYPGIELREVRS